mmetsp:Transcript_123012/g.353399  ORF Transcript_123012/g.353399 Transcript_123012/m.353399 type:complete len:285 (+) Transcript_123012:1664-2518(+)
MTAHCSYCVQADKITPVRFMSWSSWPCPRAATLTMPLVFTSLLVSPFSNFTTHEVRLSQTSTISPRRKSTMTFWPFAKASCLLIVFGGTSYTFENTSSMKTMHVVKPPQSRSAMRPRRPCKKTTSSTWKVASGLLRRTAAISPDLVPSSNSTWHFTLLSQAATTLPLRLPTYTSCPCSKLTCFATLAAGTVVTGPSFNVTLHSMALQPWMVPSVPATYTSSPCANLEPSALATIGTCAGAKAESLTGPYLSPLARSAVQLTGPPQSAMMVALWPPTVTSCPLAK